jgi:hypothetical protein
MRSKSFCGNDLPCFRKKAYLLRAETIARKTLDANRCVQSGYLIPIEIDEMITGLAGICYVKCQEINDTLVKYPAFVVLFLLFFEKPVTICYAWRPWKDLTG